MKIHIFQRIILLITGHLAGYQIVKGIEGYDALILTYFTIAFGVIVLACILLALFGFDILKNIAVISISSLIPLSLSLVIVTIYLPQYKYIFLAFVIIGIIIIIFSKLLYPIKTSTIIISIVHGISGLIISILPVYLSIRNITNSIFMVISIGGIIIGLLGILLAFHKMNRSILKLNIIYNLFPFSLFLITLFFILGFKYS